MSLKKKTESIVTYFGLVKHGKGLEDLLFSWKQISNPEKKLLIIGGKPPTNLKDKCLEKITKLACDLAIEDTIKICGYVPNDELFDYLSSTDIFVLPYKEWGEIIASSGALSVIAAYNKPIIATNVPAFIELKKYNAAIIIEPGNVDDLTFAIKKILNDEKKRTELSNRLRKFIIEHDWEKIAAKTIEVYNSI